MRRKLTINAYKSMTGKWWWSIRMANKATLAGSGGATLTWRTLQKHMRILTGVTPVFGPSIEKHGYTARVAVIWVE